MERNVLVGGEILDTHEATDCMSEYCTIHNFSDHHMVKWKQTWDFRERRIMRICSHNVAHPDPDEINPNKTHYCDTCCDPASQFNKDFEELTKEYEKPDYLTPTSTGVSTGTHWHVPSTPTTTRTASSAALDDIELLLDSLMKRHRGVDI